LGIFMAAMLTPPEQGQVTTGFNAWKATADGVAKLAVAGPAGETPEAKATRLNTDFINWMNVPANVATNAAVFNPAKLAIDKALTSPAVAAGPGVAAVPAGAAGRGELDGIVKAALTPPAPAPAAAPAAAPGAEAGSGGGMGAMIIALVAMLASSMMGVGGFILPLLIGAAGFFGGKMTGLGEMVEGMFGGGGGAPTATITSLPPAALPAGPAVATGIKKEDAYNVVAAAELGAADSGRGAVTATMNVGTAATPVTENVVVHGYRDGTKFIVDQVELGSKGKRRYTMPPGTELAVDAAGKVVFDPAQASDPNSNAGKLLGIVNAARVGMANQDAVATQEVSAVTFTGLRKMDGKVELPTAAAAGAAATTPDIKVYDGAGGRESDWVRYNLVQGGRSQEGYAYFKGTKVGDDFKVTGVVLVKNDGTRETVDIDAAKQFVVKVDPATSKMLLDQPVAVGATNPKAGEALQNSVKDAINSRRGLAGGADVRLARTDSPAPPAGSDLGRPFTPPAVIDPSRMMGV
jgi:hypothetical protein